MDNIYITIISAMLQPIEHISPEQLMDYANQMKLNANDNIEDGIAEMALRVAKFRQMSQAIIRERSE